MPGMDEFEVASPRVRLGRAWKDLVVCGSRQCTKVRFCVRLGRYSNSQRTGSHQGVSCEHAHASEERKFDKREPGVGMHVCVDRSHTAIIYY